MEHRSRAELWPPLARLVSTEARIGQWAKDRGGWRRFIYEFVRFGLKQAWACAFAGLMLALVVTTWLVYPANAAIARYDFLFIASVSLQIALLASRFESPREAGVIAIFHVVGTIMELFKTAHGSWVYPEAAFFKIGGVPLFSGFMYASVGSYMMRAWDLFDFRFTRHPPLWQVGLLAIAIYVNFFTHHFIWDARLVLFATAALMFGRTTIYYRIHHQWRTMPLLLAALLAASFIWFAENAATLSRIWLYPHQVGGWRPVGFGKLGSWFLLQIISYALVAMVCRPIAPGNGPIELSKARHAARLGSGAQQHDPT